MNYKREEPFRYVFSPPLSCNFKIIQLGKKDVSSSIGSGSILDLSPNGLKLGTTLKIPLGSQEIRVRFHFKVNLDMIAATGILVWSRESYHSHFHYGVKFDDLPELSQLITNEVKIHAKTKKSVV